MALSGSVTFVDGQAAQVDRCAGGGTLVRKESSIVVEGWGWGRTVKDVVDEA